MYALSEKADKLFQNDCKHEHTDIFESCLLVSLCNKNVHDAYKIVVNEITKDIAGVMNLDFLYAGKTIQDWHTHCLRAVHQDYAKQHVLSNLKSNEGLMLLDRAMKFIPFLHQEKQTDFFGRKGISWHFC